MKYRLCICNLIEMNRPNTNPNKSIMKKLIKVNKLLIFILLLIETCFASNSIFNIIVSLSFLIYLYLFLKDLKKLIWGSLNEDSHFS